MRIVANGTWLYDSRAAQPVDVVALDYDWSHRLALADGDLEDGEEPEPMGPDGVLYYVRFRRAGETTEPTWVDSAGYASIDEAMAHAATRVPTPIRWAAAERAGEAGDVRSRVHPAGVAWIVVTLLWSVVALLALVEQVLQPRDLVPPLLAGGIALGLVLWIIAGASRPAVRAGVARFPVATAMATLVAAGLGGALTGEVLMVILLWLMLPITGLAVAIVALSRLRRHRLDSGVALGLFVVLLAVLSPPGVWLLDDTAMAVRVRVVAPRYRVIADELLARPAAPEERYDPGRFYEPFVGTDAAGRPVAVAWIWRRGQFLGASTAVVYRPGTGMAPGRALADVYFFSHYGGRRTCRALVDDWYSCAME